MHLKLIKQILILIGCAVFHSDKTYLWAHIIQMGRIIVIFLFLCNLMIIDSDGKFILSHLKFSSEVKYCNTYLCTHSGPSGLFLIHLKWTHFVLAFECSCVFVCYFSCVCTVMYTQSIWDHGKWIGVPVNIAETVLRCFFFVSVQVQYFKKMINEYYLLLCFMVHQENNVVFSYISNAFSLWLLQNSHSTL